MAVKTPVKIGEHVVVVRELAVEEVRDWMVAIEGKTHSVDPVGDFLFEDVAIADLEMMCEMPEGFSFDALTPSQIQPILEEARKLNPHFFRVRAVVAAAMQSMLQDLLKGVPTASSVPLSPLSHMATAMSGDIPGASS